MPATKSYPLHPLHTKQTQKMKTVRLSSRAADARKTPLVDGEVIQADNQAKPGLDLDGFVDIEASIVVTVQLKFPQCSVDSILFGNI